MYAHRIKITLTEDGTITLDKLPFQTGDEVEIIILASPHASPGKDPYPLRGKPVQYDQPTEPIAEADWEALE
jgi:hypothetical protein